MTIELTFEKFHQPALFAHELLFRISVAPLLGEPAAENRGTDMLLPAGPFVVVSEVRGPNADLDSLTVGAW